MGLSWIIVRCFLSVVVFERRSYTAAFKLECAVYAKEHGNRATGRKYKVNEKQVRDWRKDEETLRRTEKTKKANRGQHAKWPELEKTLETWILEQRAKHKGVSTIQMRLKARQLAKSMKIEDFTGSPSWCVRFMQRKKLSE